MPDVKLSQLFAQSPATVAEGAKLWTHKGHMDGLILEWVDGTTLRLTSGSAFIEGLGYAVAVPAPITKSGLSLAAGSWYHVYLRLNAGVPDVEVVTTAPAAPYNGTARSKGGDATRRYLGTFLTNSGGGMKAFKQSAHYFAWMGRNSIVPHHVLAAGTATSQTPVSLAGIVPFPGIVAMLHARADSSAGLQITNAEAASFAVIEVGPGAEVITPFPVDSTHSVAYANAAAPAVGANLYVPGFFVER